MVNNDAVVRTSYYKYFHPKVIIVLTVVKLHCFDHISSRVL